MNVDSLEWDRMIRSFKNVSERGFDGDYSKYDAKMRARLIVEYFVDLVNAWYDDGPENALIRRVLMEEVAFTIHRSGNVIYLSMQGNKSGCVVTTILNCVIGDFYVKCGWIALLDEEIVKMKIGMNQGEICPNFERVVSARALHNAWGKLLLAAIYGDDNVVIVADDLLPIFNAETFGAWLERYEIEYTPAAKGVRTEAFSEVEKLQFLKRHVRMSEYGFYLAPIDKQTIFELTNWIRKCPDTQEAMYVNIMDSMRFAFSWGRDFFESHRKCVNDALRKARMDTVKCTYLDYELEYITKNT